MSPVELHGGEVRYYSSPIMVKTQQYTATLTSERLIIEGGSAPREFKVTNIVTAEKAALDNGEPALKIILSTPSGQKEMIWGFPVGEVFKPGEQQAWIDNIQKVHGEKPFAVPAPKQDPARATSGAAPQVPKAPTYSPGEMEILQTAGVRIKRTYYTLYLTNLRLILQNSNGQIGREFAVAELMDAGKMESESGEPSIALTVGSQTGVKQMILTFPSPGAREAWMTQISAKLPSQILQMPPQPGMMPPAPSPMGGAQPQQPSMLTLQPGERTLISSPGIRVKRDVYTAYLTNTRFVLMGNSYGMLSVAGEFSVNTLRKAARMASELSEPGIALKMIGRDGEKEMHLIFPSMELREMWLDQLVAVIPKVETPAFAPPPPQYSTTTVTPPSQTGGGSGSGNVKFCTVCGTRNHPDDRFCAMCGKPLDSGGRAPAAAPVPDIYGSSDGYDEYDEAPRSRNQKRSKPQKSRKPRQDEYDSYGMQEKPRGKKQRPPKRRREPKQKAHRQYDGGILGFLLHPSDAYEYYRQESPGEAIMTFLISGVVWAVVSVLLLAFAVPKLLNITQAEFPILAGLQGNMMAVVMLIVMMLLLWIIFLVIQSVITAILAKVFGEDASIGEVLAVVMRSTLPYAVIGWIPGFGVVIAALWSTFTTSKGLEASLNMRGGSAIGAALIGFVLVAVILIAVGLI